MAFRWNDWNVEHIGQHGVLPEEAEQVIQKMRKSKPYWEMNTNELAKATEEFDRPFVIDQSSPLTPAERRQWERVRPPKRGRPKVGEGFKRVSLSLEQDLLQRVTDLAKKRRMSRSRFVALVLAAALAHERS